MSSKSSGSSRHSSPRAMPVETIITRFKSAQQKKQLREMDRSMTKVTELLKNPLKPKIKKKATLKKVPSSNNIVSVKEDEGRKKTRKNKAKNSETVDTDEEYCPLKLKRTIVLNKVRLKPKHDLKIIAQTNKRKRSVPKKGLALQDNSELSIISESLSRDASPKAKRTKSLPQDMTMDEMIQLIEDSGSLNDEDLLEILTCPSPVWWEDPPDGYIEDALFTRPRSTAEMYPSIRSQLQEDLQERQRSSTPNVLSRRKRGKPVSNNVKVEKNETKESINNNDDIDLEITLGKCDEKFIRKRSKLESVLGNLKNKTFKNNDIVNKVANYDKISNVSVNSDNMSNKVSVIKNLSSDKTIKCDGNVEYSCTSMEVNMDKKKQASVPMETDHDSTDDEPLTDISFQDDAYLNDLENMDIPMQININDSPEKQLVEEIKRESLHSLTKDVKKDDDSEVAVPHFKEQTKKQHVVRNACTVSDCASNKCRTTFKDRSIDPTYSDKESSVIEDYFEMKLFEEDDTIVNKKQNEYSKSQLNTQPVTSVKCTNNCKQNESNLTTSVIKFQNSDNTSINVFKIESFVPKSLPPLENSDNRKGNIGCVPENLPPLKRNPGVIHLNSESPKSNNSTTSYDTSESCNSISAQDNMDSISDTNICFMNEDDDDSCNDKKIDNITELENTSLNTVIKSSSVIQTSELSLHDLSHTRNNELPRNESKCNDFPTDELHFTQDVNLYKNLTHYNGVIANKSNELEFQSLTITKVNNNSCCKVRETKLDSKLIKKNDMNVMNCEKKRFSNDNPTDLMTEDLITTKSKSCSRNEFNSPIHNEIIKIGNENTECITVYKIVSDDSGNEEPKNEVSSNLKNLKVKTKDLQDMLDVKDSNSDYKSDDSMEKSDINRDKMIFYFKKCKNLHWKHKNSDKSEDNKPDIVTDDFLVNKPKIADIEDTKDKIENFINLKLNKSGSLEENIETESENDKKETSSEVNHNNNLTNPDQKEQKCIIVSNTKQIRYCMKCSSIFDTAQCNYCYRKNGADNKNHCATDYLLKMEQCFVCDVCRYKALSKDSLERHITSRCCDSKYR